MTARLGGFTGSPEAWAEHDARQHRPRRDARQRLVILESPYAPTQSHSLETHLAYARAALADSLRRGEAPIASHLLYTQPGVLDDTVPDERALGIAAGLAWGRVADLTAVYSDLGLSKGMLAGIERAKEDGRPLDVRTLPGWETETTRSMRARRAARDER